MDEQTQLLRLLHLNDSAFPTGAFSHSFGLEAYTQAGIVRDARTLRDYLMGRLLDGMVRFDLVILREALHTAQTNNPETIIHLDERLSAMMTTHELREASTQVGRRFLRTALPLYGKAASQRYFDSIQQKRCSGHYAIAYATILADMGVGSDLALITYTNNFIMSQATARD